ncbi:MAG: hypothetical protein IJ325_07320 [Clostridia bacterium]|nr:hypothetical protein [Clostridia bacterium]MBQ8640580.1 hypothetical protein [Clostridia bacterium]
MDGKNLAQMVWLKKEILLEERRIREMEQENGESVQGGKTADRRRELIQKRRERCVAELTALEQYITSIDDSLTRQIFVYRYAYGMNWLEVAGALGGGNTADGVKKRCQRWLAAHPETAE